MPSRSNDEDKDKAIKARSYGAPTGPAMPSTGVVRRKVAEASDADRKKAIAADVAASRQPVKTPPRAPAAVGQPNQKMPAAFSVFRAADDLKKRKRMGEDQ